LEIAVERAPEVVTVSQPEHDVAVVAKIWIDDSEKVINASSIFNAIEVMESLMKETVLDALVTLGLISLERCIDPSTPYGSTSILEVLDVLDKFKELK